MSLTRACFAMAATLLLLVACGGSVANGGGDGDAGASSGAGSNGKAGSTSKAGNGSGTGGVSSSGGSTAAGGTPSLGGGAGVGGMNCDLVLCAYPDCANGAEPITPPGQCCPVCSPVRSGCDSVQCEPIMGCSDGYERGTPPGACCEGCVPQAGGVSCPEIACPPDDKCPLGYVRGDALGGCCTHCVPDPNFCHTAADCLIADRPRPCCECPEAISVRAYKADACWSAPSMPRTIPEECKQLDVCPAICVPCPTPGAVACSENRCVELATE